MQDRMSSGTDNNGDCRPEYSLSSNVEVSQHVDGHARLSKCPSVDDLETISPLMLSKSKEVDDFELEGEGRFGRQNPLHAELGSTTPVRSSSNLAACDSWTVKSVPPRKKYSGNDLEHDQGISIVLEEVVAWLRAEKVKKLAREVKRNCAKRDRADFDVEDLGSISHPSIILPNRRVSDESDDESPDLERLESILEKGLAIRRPPSPFHKRRSRRKKRYESSVRTSSRRPSVYKSSDTERYDEDITVPSCDVVLDNPPILIGTSGVESGVESVSALPESSLVRVQEAWTTFKYDVCRLAQTLKIRGWRHLSLSSSNGITIERLSGALTNAVYVVTPPRQVLSTPNIEGTVVTRRRAPLKLILRIYGPRVEHLIDRETELQVLRRLARKNIGPRLLGIFKNGRFEEFFNAKPLQSRDLREPETSQKIAKRMRELHEGIELLREERSAGPMVWRNWDKWVSRAENLIPRADAEFQRQDGGQIVGNALPDPRRFVCGTNWKFFRQTVEKYREQLGLEYGSLSKLTEHLVFAHNDTQYGNILRLEPPGESPLLLPANQHKQLVVIDFEYANANVPGFELANHFTEWCYNYNDPDSPFKCNTAWYPSVEEQYRFIRAYVLHRPQHRHTASPVPRLAPLHLSRSMSSLDLGSQRGNLASPSPEQFGSPGPIRGDTDQHLQNEIQWLMRETRLWRLANSAQWVLWGILQSNLPDDSHSDEVGSSAGHACGERTVALESHEKSTSLKEEGNGNNKGDVQIQTENASAGGFDYLSYARERAMFFWGDCLQLGLATEGALGEDLMKEVKIVTQ